MKIKVQSEGNAINTKVFITSPDGEEIRVPNITKLDWTCEARSKGYGVAKLNIEFIATKTCPIELDVQGKLTTEHLAGTLEGLQGQIKTIEMLMRAQKEKSDEEIDNDKGEDNAS